MCVQGCGALGQLDMGVVLWGVVLVEGSHACWTVTDAEHACRRGAIGVIDAYQQARVAHGECHDAVAKVVPVNDQEGAIPPAGKAAQG